MQQADPEGAVRKISFQNEHVETSCLTGIRSLLPNVNPQDCSRLLYYICYYSMLMYVYVPKRSPAKT